jgi:uncharacterized protein (TIGR02996 family)
MSDRAALLAAICAHPDEDTPRLVYADWLEENGASKRARAIRAAVEHHRLQTADTPAAALGGFLTWYEGGRKRIDWRAVDAELGAYVAAEHAAEMFRATPRGEGVPLVKGVLYESTSRGFYNRLEIQDASAFLKSASAIFGAAPITALDFDRLTAEQAAEFVATGHLARVRSLGLVSDCEPDAIRLLGNHRDAAGVRELDLFDAGSGSPGPAVEALAAGQHWSGLERLDVSDLADSDEPPDDQQMAELFARPQFRNLRALTAWGSEVGPRAVKALVKNLTVLRALDISSNPISERGWSALATARTLRHLRHLDLRWCDREGADPAPLIAGAHLPNLALLLLGGAHLNGPDPKVLARPGRGPGLRALDLRGSVFSAGSAEALAASPSVRGLWYLELGAAGLGDEHLERFVARAEFDRLAYLDLSHNELTARGAKALASWPGAARLQGLNIGGNALGEAGARALAASPYLKGLKYLHSTGRGTILLKKRFKKVFE